MKSSRIVAAVLALSVVVSSPSAGQDPQPALRGLKSQDAAERAKAAWDLARTGATGPDVTAALRAAVKDESRAVRVRAALALAAGDPGAVKAAKEVLPGLIAARNDPDEAVRTKADEVWADLAPGVRAALPVVRRSLGTANDPASLKKAVEALAKSGLEAVPALLDAAVDERTVGPPFVPQQGQPAPASTRLQDALAGALAEIGAPVVPALEEALRDSSAAVRETAALALGRLGAAARPAAPSLIGLFKDRDPFVRLRAADALGLLGPVAADVEPALAAAVANRDPVARRAAVGALVQLPTLSRESVAALTTALDDPDPIVRVKAATALCQADAPPAPALAALVEELRGRDATARAQATQLVEKLGPKAAPARDRLLAVLRDRDRPARLAAARALAAIGGADAKTAAEALRGLLTEDSPLVRVQAAEALWNLGAVRDALPVILAASNSADVATASTARNVLQRLDVTAPNAKDFVAPLADALGDDTPGVRTRILELLRRMGPTAKPAAPAVVRVLMSTNDDQTRQAASTTLGTLGGPTAESLPDLVAGLQSTNAITRNLAARLIEQFGTAAKAAVPDLKEILTSGTDDAKIQAIRVLRRVSPADAKAAIPSVADTLRGKDLNARAQALQLASELGPDAKPLVPALKELADDGPPHVRLQAIQAMQRVSPEDARAAAAGLGELIRGPDVNLRNQAMQVVAEIGPEGVKAVLPAVLEGLKSPTPATRSAALTAASRLNAVQHPEARDAVLALLKGADANTRLQVVSLFQFGTAADAKVVVPALTELLKDPLPLVRVVTAEALYRYGDEGKDAAVSAARALLSDADVNTRIRAARLLLQPGPATAEDRKAAASAVAVVIRDGPATQRTQALFALQTADADAIRAAVPGLRTALSDTDPAVRMYAARVIVRLDGEPRAAGIKVLADVAAERNPRTSPMRNEAMSLLRSLGADGEKVLVPLLIEGLRDQFGRTQAAAELANLSPEAAKPSLPALVELLADPQPFTQIAAAQALVRLGGPAEHKAVGNAMVALVRDSKSGSQTTAANVLQGMGPEWRKAALAAFREALKDPASFNRLAAARVLAAEEGEDRKAAVAVLAELAKSGVAFERTQAAELLARADPSRLAEAVAALKEQCADPRSRTMAAIALARLGPDHAAALVPTLRAMLTDPQQYTREQAVRLLGELGPAAKEAVPDLADALRTAQNPTPAAEALGRIGGDGITVLTKALAGPTDSVVSAAAYGLALAGPEAKDAVPELVRVAFSPPGPGGYTRANARLAIVQTGGPGVERLLKELASPVPDRRRAAAEIFVVYGGATGAAVTALEKAAGDDDLGVRVTAARAAFQAGSRADAVVKALADGFKAPDATLRQGAAFTAASADTTPDSLLTAAKVLLANADGHTRVFAAQALVRHKETAEDAARVLIEALRSPALRIAAANALAAPGVQLDAVKDAVPALREILRDPTTRAYHLLIARTAAALGRIGGPEAIEALVGGLTTGEQLTRQHFAPPLRDAGPDGIAALRKLLDHPTGYVRVLVVEALGPEVARDPKVTAALVNCLRDPDPLVRSRAVAMLRWAGPKNAEVTKAATGLLGDLAPAARAEAAITVAYLRGTDDRATAVAAIRAALAAPDAVPATTARLAEAAGRFGAAAAPALAELTPLLSRSEPILRAKAAEAVGRIGKLAKNTVPTLTRLLDATDARVKASAAVALWRITGDAKRAVPVLVDALDDAGLRRSYVEPRAVYDSVLPPGVAMPAPGPSGAGLVPEEPMAVAMIRALGEMGTDAKPAAATLRQLAKDTDPEVRAAAAAALKKIE